MKAREQEFLKLIAQHKRIILKISKTYADDPEEQSDLAQEITAQLWKSFDTFRHQSLFSTWMYRVSLNTAITFFRKTRKNNAKEVDIEECYNLADNEAQDDDGDKLAHFYKAVHQLSSIEKALIFLFLEGRSHKEIAQDLGISEGNARVKLSRTKDKLQQIIKKNGYEF